MAAMPVCSVGKYGTRRRNSPPRGEIGTSLPDSLIVLLVASSSPGLQIGGIVAPSRTE
jgi:hypothetical protein